jgi:hypothetical protein
MVSSKREYTRNEKELLAILLRKRGKRISSSDIVSLHFSTRRKPKNANRSVTTVLNGLILKTRKNQEDFRIYKSRRDGPRSIQWWSE